ncbi:hypothetical protein AUP68_08969 [Ilyonectria robusta]
MSPKKTREPSWPPRLDRKPDWRRWSDYVAWGFQMRNVWEYVDPDSDVILPKPTHPGPPPSMPEGWRDFPRSAKMDLIHCSLREQSDFDHDFESECEYVNPDLDIILSEAEFLEQSFKQSPTPEDSKSSLESVEKTISEWKREHQIWSHYMFLYSRDYRHCKDDQEIIENLTKEVEESISEPYRQYISSTHDMRETLRVLKQKLMLPPHEETKRARAKFFQLAHRRGSRNWITWALEFESAYRQAVRFGARSIDESFAVDAFLSASRKQKSIITNDWYHSKMAERFFEEKELQLSDLVTSFCQCQHTLAMLGY